MNYKKQYKTFIKAYELICKENRLFTSYFKDRRISQAERTLLKSLYAIKKGKALETIGTLNSFTGSSDFLESVRLNLLGNCYNNSGQFKKAVECYGTAVPLLSQMDDEYYIFYPLVSLVEAHLNLKNVDECKKYYLNLKRIKKTSHWRKAKFLQTEACYFSLIGDHVSALKNLDECLDKYEAEVESQKAYLYTIKLITLFKANRIDEFIETLEIYKVLRGYKIKENYKYMDTLVSYIYKDASIYAYERDFASIPYLYHQLMVIKSLRCFEIERAKKSWTFLQTENPFVYKDDFQLTGDDSLFSKALEKVKRESQFEQESQFDLETLHKLKTVQDKLHYILTNKDGAVSSEELIKLIWNEELSEKSLFKLSVQISRLRKKSKEEIKVKSGHYYIKKSA
tara:strand:+ start:2698 stop:3888 length:1191 start_codon:yes stop_codon:yes gene_type:complete